ncbi:hypothetical protein [Streptomyces platensis]|nr:hypothetical protein [Streptomyces platensis]
MRPCRSSAAAQPDQPIRSLIMNSTTLYRTLTDLTRHAHHAPN